MKIIPSIADLREAVAEARKGRRSVGFVPTMGALHEGHLSLIRRAATENDAVVVSIFVNPKQFEDQRDLDAYPRDEAADVSMAAKAGAAIIFTPSASTLYPAGYTTVVRVEGQLTQTLEGALRGQAHFAGVTTVVNKLLNIVAADTAYFGQKDAQQALVVQRMVRDLDMGVRIVVCPTIRDADGLALSSRNVRLSSVAREQALAIPRALQRAVKAVAGGVRVGDQLVATAQAELRQSGLEPEYVALVMPDTLAPIQSLSGKGLLAIAADVDGVRLIDNAILVADGNAAAV